MKLWVITEHQNVHEDQARLDSVWTNEPQAVNRMAEIVQKAGANKVVFTTELDWTKKVAWDDIYYEVKRIESNTVLE